MVNKTPQALAAYLAPRIKKAIRDSDKSYEVIGEDVGVSKTAVSKWTTTGQIQLANLWALSRSTGKPMAWFFPGYDESPADAESAGDAARLEVLLQGASADAIDDFLIEVLEARRALRDS